MLKKNGTTYPNERIAPDDPLLDAVYVGSYVLDCHSESEEKFDDLSQTLPHLF